MLGNRVFVDSNIWLYAFIQEAHSEKRSVAVDLISAETYTIVVSCQVINEICVNLLKKAKASEDLLEDLVNDFFVRYEIILNDRLRLLHASNLRRLLSISYWDSFIVASALDSGCSILYTEDLQHGQVIDGQLTVLNPFLGG